MHIIVHFNIQFVVCDYAEKCSSSRWYHFDENNETINKKSTRDYICSRNDTKTSIIQNFSTYIDSNWGFKLDYPSDWRLEYEGLMDPVVLNFNPPGVEPVTLLVWVELWPIAETAKESSEEYIKEANEPGSTSIGTPFIKVKGNNSISINSNDAYKIIYTYKGENGETYTEMQIRTIINNSMYIFIMNSFDQYFFEKYLPVINKIISSFELVNSTGILCHVPKKMI